jgi:putative hydrolase of the HAD superfamily
MNRSKLLNRIKELTQPLSPIGIDHPVKLHKLPDIQCVAFDFYGTMFISAIGDIGIDEDQQSQSADYFTHSLNDTGLTILDQQAGKRGQKLFKDTITAHISIAKNNGIDHPEPDVRAVWLEVLQKLRQEGYISGPISRDTAIRFGVEFEFRINDIWPVPGLKKALSTLKTSGLQLGIISNSQFYTPIAFDTFLGSTPERFGFTPELLVWSFETGRKKPSKRFYQIFNQSAQKMGLKPEQVLYVGNDMRKDIQPAQALGIRTALYVGDERSIRHDAKELESGSFQPDIVIDKLQQIEQCLQR